MQIYMVFQKYKVLNFIRFFHIFNFFINKNFTIHIKKKFALQNDIKNNLSSTFLYDKIFIIFIFIFIFINLYKFINLLFYIKYIMIVLKNIYMHF